MCRTQLIFVLLSATLANLAYAESETETLLAKSDTAIQPQIAAVFNSIGKPDTFQELHALQEMCGDRAKLVEQLAIFAVTAENPVENQDLYLVMMIHYSEISPSTIVRVLAPHLDSDNKQLRDFADSWFRYYDKDASEDTLEAYKSYVRRCLSNHEGIPSEFVEYIYERLQAGQALLVFQAAQRPLRKYQDVLLAEHLISNAIWLNKHDFQQRYQAALPEAQAELHKLASHQEWWARLYVVWVMRRHKEFRDETILESLRKDANSLVSKAANELKL